MLKRVILLMVVLSMVASLFVGCKASTDSTPAPTTEPTVVSESSITPVPATLAPGATPTPTPVPGSKATVTKPSTKATPFVPDRSKTMTIRIGSDQLETFNNDAIGKEISKKLNIRVVPVSVGTDDTKLILYASNNTLPDMFGADISSALFNRFRKDGNITDVPVDLIEKFPVLYRETKLQNAIMAQKAITTKIWATSRLGDPGFTTGVTQHAIVYRKDWAQKVGFTKPLNTVDDFYQMIKLFKTKNAGNIKDGSTYGMTSWLWQMNYIPWADLYNWAKDTDGKYKPEYLIPSRFQGAVKYFNKLYSEQLIPRDFATATVAQAYQQFSSDIVGAVDINANGPYHIWDKLMGIFAKTKNLKDQDFTSMVNFVPPLSKDASSPKKWCYTDDTYITVYSAALKKDLKKFERCLDLLEYLRSTDGQMLVNYGFKGKDYIITGGKAQRTLPPIDPNSGIMKKLWQVYPSIQIAQLACSFSENRLPVKPKVLMYPKLAYDFYDKIIAKQKPLVVPQNLNVINIARVVLSDLKADYMANYFPNVETDIINVIKSDPAQVDKNYTDMVNRYLTTYKGNQVIAEVNKRLK